MFKGWIGEKKTAFRLWLWLSSKKYQTYHNIILPSRSGTTQIDHIVVSQFGVFIIETKNKKGWIFGSADNATWTQVIYKKKYSFQNPLKQTFRQKKILAEFLDLREKHIHPIVFFVGRCSFRTSLPSNVRRSWLTIYIKKFKDLVLAEHEVALINATLQEHIKASTLTKRDHLYSLKRRHESTTHCPRCGSNLVVRTVKKGNKAGSQFLGCEAFPKCRFTKILN